MAYKSTTIYLRIVKNNAELVQLYANDGFADSSSVTAHTELSVGDHVWVENFGPAGSQLHDSSFNCFSGILDNQN